LMTVEGPVTRIVGHDVEGADCPDWHVDRALGKLRTFGNPSAIGAGHVNMVAVQVDRVVGHGEIAHAHAHAVAEAYRQRVDSREHAAVPGPHVEVRHFRHLRQVGAGIDEIRAHDEDEVAIDAAELPIARMHDEHAHHAHGHLHHLVGVWVVHECPAAREHEFVDEGL